MATTSRAAAAAEFRDARLVSDAIKAVLRRPLLYFGVSLVAALVGTLPSVLMSRLAQDRAEAKGAADTDFSLVAISGLGFAVGTLAVMLGIGVSMVLNPATIDDAQRLRTPVSRLLPVGTYSVLRAWPLMLPGLIPVVLVNGALGAGVAWAIGNDHPLLAVLAGLVLLAAACLFFYLFLRFILAPQVMSVERVGPLLAPWRSVELTSGDLKPRVFGVLISTGVVVGVIGTAIGQVVQRVALDYVEPSQGFSHATDLAQGARFMANSSIGTGVASFVLSPFVVAIMARVYLEARVRNGEIDPDTIRGGERLSED
ncbi:hypothetical protein [Luteipulveratus mongoliensis]|nr:hypothetical protein [Luteipulveratus mongoliensis]